MGMYTEIFFRGNIKFDAPDEVKEAVGAIAEGTGKRPDIDHPLFDCPRWDCLGNCSSAYFPPMSGSFVSTDVHTGEVSLTLHANLKNYHSEIELFFDWINPYVDALPGEFLGYSLYEDVDPETAPTPYFKKETTA